MPRYNWFKHTKLGSEGCRTKRLNKRASHNGYIKRKIKPVSYYKINKQPIYEIIRIGCYKTQLYRLKDIANIYGIHQATVIGWYNKKMLPKPIILKNDKYRNWGWSSSPLYSKEQLLIICRVLNDIFRQGITHYRKSHIKHINMMHEGNDIYLSTIAHKAGNKSLRKQLNIKM